MASRRRRQRTLQRSSKQFVASSVQRVKVKPVNVNALLRKGGGGRQTLEQGWDNRFSVDYNATHIPRFMPDAVYGSYFEEEEELRRRARRQHREEVRSPTHGSGGGGGGGGYDELPGATVLPNLAAPRVKPMFAKGSVGARRGGDGGSGGGGGDGGDGGRGGTRGAGTGRGGRLPALGGGQRNAKMARKISSAQQREQEAKERLVRELLEHHERDKEARLARWRRSYQREAGMDPSKIRAKSNGQFKLRQKKKKQEQDGGRAQLAVARKGQQLLRADDEPRGAEAGGGGGGRGGSGGTGRKKPAKLDRFSASVLALGGHIDEFGAHYTSTPPDGASRTKRDHGRHNNSSSDSRSNNNGAGSAALQEELWKVEGGTRQRGGGNGAALSRHAAEQRMKALLHEQEAELDGLYSTLMVMTAQRAARGFLARRRVAARRAQEEAETLAMLQEGSAIEAARAKADLKAALAAKSADEAAVGAAAAKTTAAINAGPQPGKADSGSAGSAEEVTTAGPAAAPAGFAAGAGLHKSEGGGTSEDGELSDSASFLSDDEDTDDLDDDDQDEDDDVVGNAAGVASGAEKLAAAPPRQLQFSMMGAVTADHKRDLNVKTGLVRAVLAQRVARGFLARRRLRRAVAGASSAAIAGAAAAAAAAADSAAASADDAGAGAAATESCASAAPAEAVSRRAHPTETADVEGAVPLAKAKAPTSNKTDTSVGAQPAAAATADLAVARPDKPSGEDAAFRPDTDSDASSPSSSSALPPPPPLSCAAAGLVQQAAVLAQRIGRGFIGRLRAARLATTEQADNLALLQRGSAAEVGAEARALRDAQVVTAQRVVRGQLARRQVQRRAAAEEAETLAMLQQGSQMEASLAGVRWKQLREEYAQHLAAVQYMQALVRGHLARRSGRLLTDDNGDFSEAEADDEDADDFF